MSNAELIELLRTELSYSDDAATRSLLARSIIRLSTLSGIPYDDANNSILQKAKLH